MAQVIEMRVALFVIEDTSARQGFLLRTCKGKAVFGPLEAAATYSSMRAVRGAIARIRGNYAVAFRNACLEVFQTEGEA